MVQNILLTKISVGYQSLQHSTFSSIIIYFQLVRETPPFSGQVVDFEILIRETPPFYGQNSFKGAKLLNIRRLSLDSAANIFSVPF